MSKWKNKSDSRFKVGTIDLIVNKPMPFEKGIVEVFPHKLTDPKYEAFGKITDVKKTSGRGKTLYRKK